MTSDLNVSAAARSFEIDGEFIEAQPYGSGHINDTSCSGSITTSSKTLKP